MHGTKCANWNSEGQWLLRRDAIFDAAFKPGRMCPVDKALLQDIHLFSAAKQKLHMQWGEYWSSQDTASSLFHASSKILVEKSPHNMVKIPFIAQAFQHARSLRFIVVIKHPITLNIALPRGHQWMSRISPASFALRDQNQKGNTQRTSLVEKQKLPWTLSDLLEGFEHFITFMNGNVSSGPECNLGWLLAMEELMFNTRGNLSSSITIVKYEDFIDPIKTCQDIMDVAAAGHEQDNTQTFGRFCKRNFSPKIRMSNGLKTSENILIQHRGKHDRSNRLYRQSNRNRIRCRRNLRLKATTKGPTGGVMTGIKEKSGYQTLEFDLKMVENSVHNRLVDFGRAYDLLHQWRTKDSNLRGKFEQIIERLQDIDARLSKFGYSLLPINTVSVKNVEVVVVEKGKVNNLRPRSEFDPRLGIMNGSIEFTKMRLRYRGE